VNLLVSNYVDFKMHGATIKAQKLCLSWNTHCMPILATRNR